MSKVYIGLMGLGEVGGSVAQILRDYPERIWQRAGVEICVKCAFVRHVDRYQGFDFPITDQINDLLDDEEISIIVELIGGVDYPFEIAKKVFQKKKALVTANKAMLAYHADALMEYSKGLPFGFEASVCGGMPVVELLRNGLVANELGGFEGIFNGTSNFILTQMFQERCEFETALSNAQKLGYAEMDSSLDISGKDAGHKLLILARLAYAIQSKPEDILIEGIEGIELDDLDFACQLGYVIKLLGIARKNNNILDLRLHPVLIPKHHVLAGVDGVKNAIYLLGDCMGDLFMSGFGAGGGATASAVIADLVQIVRLREFSSYPHPSFGFFNSQEQILLKPKEEICAEYYLRFIIKDHHGSLEQIAKVLSGFDISVNQIFQKDLNDEKKIFITTHKTNEINMNSALRQLENCFIQSPYKIRIHNE